MADTSLHHWSTTAVNLPDHADNKIHTDAGARAAGFPSALVAGTTVYAYLTHVPVSAWGLNWLGGGGGELRLRRPVFDRDQVDCIVHESSVHEIGATEDRAGITTVTSQVGGEDRATLDLWEQTVAPAMRDGDPLRPLNVTLTTEHSDYGIRAGDDLTVYTEMGIAHPVVWANLANSVFIENLVTGPWIHVRSRIHHEGVAKIGSNVHIDAVLLSRFQSRAGERALVDMRIYADDAPVATIEHEAIIVLP